MAARKQTTQVTTGTQAGKGTGVVVRKAALVTVAAAKTSATVSKNFFHGFIEGWKSV